MARTTPTPDVTPRLRPTAASTQAIITAATKRRRRPSRALGTDVLLALLVPALLIAIWWYFSAQSSSPFFPPLSEILVRFREMWLFERVPTDVVPSLARMFAGYGIAVVVGVALGVVCGRIRPIYAILSPFVHFGRAVPAAALLPAAITLLGVGDPMKVMLIAFVCCFPILLNTIDAVASVGSGLEDVSRTFQFTPWQRLVYVLLPFAAPRIFAGARIALSIALIMMIVSEMLAATNGIGFVTLHAQQTFAIRDMWAGMILLGVLGTLITILFLVIERRVIRWNPNTSKTES